MSESSDASPFTTYVPRGCPRAEAARRAVRIAQDAIAVHPPRSRSRSARYVAHAYHEDKRRLFDETVLITRGNRFNVGYACDRDRFEIRISCPLGYSGKPLATVRERHPLGTAPPRLDRDEILAVLERWSGILSAESDLPHRGWRKAADHVAALARTAGAPDDLPKPHHLTLPSPYAAGILRPDRATTDHPLARAGTDIDLFPDSATARTVSRLCHCSRLESRIIDHRGSGRLDADLSGPVVVRAVIPDPVSALRILTETARTDPRDQMRE